MLISKIPNQSYGPEDQEQDFQQEQNQYGVEENESQGGFVTGVGGGTMG